MLALQRNKYWHIFQAQPFRLFWTGFTLSVLGDSMARVALTWYIYELTGSAEALGLLALTYTGPVVVGGLAAGWLLDRFDRRRVMLADNLLRGAAMLAIPLLHGLGTLAAWHIYAASAVYGSLMMISLAGSPAIVPSLVEDRHLVTANALETLSYTLSGIGGPLIAGLLIPLISAPHVVLLDAASYFFFALMLARIAPFQDRAQTQRPAADGSQPGYSLRAALRLLLNNRILLSTTLMFMAFNLGFGALFVWLPILTDRALGGGSELYGALLGVMALGQVMSSLLSGLYAYPLSLGRLICLSQALSGLALLIMAFSLSIPAAVLSLMLAGAFSAPLTIWAQTLRMQIIPPDMRGRTFALLRTMMQGTGPVGGAAGGFLLPWVSLPLMLALSAAVIGLPGLLGWTVRELREAGPPDSR